MSDFNKRRADQSAPQQSDSVADRSMGSHGKSGAATEAVADAASKKAGAVADNVTRRASENLSSLADSVRRASDEYGKSEPGLLADLMGHAADGLDTLAHNVSGRSASDMVGTARDFGRRNPVGLMLSGVVAGFALSRLAVGMTKQAASSAAPRTTASAGSARPASQSASFDTAQGGFTNDT